MKTIAEMKKYLRANRPRVAREGYPEEVKKRAVDFVAHALPQVSSVRVLSKKLGLGEETLGNWIKGAKVRSVPKKTPEKAAVAHLVTVGLPMASTVKAEAPDLGEALWLAGVIATKEKATVRVWREVPITTEVVCKESK